MKKIITILCSILLTLSLLPVYGAEDSALITEKTLIQGVTYTHMEKLYENGWQDIYIVRADLNEPHLYFDVLKHSQGESYLQNTFDMAVAADATAAINADFFASKRGESNRGSAIGMEMTDGVLRSSPAAYENMNVLYQPKEDAALYFNHFDYNFTVTAPDGTSDQIVVINKYDDIRGIVMYTRDWNTTSIGSDADLMEIVVTDGVVTGKHRNEGPVEIPENGYVLVANLTLNTFLDDHLNVGDSVSLSLSTTPNFQNMETAVGGGGMILVGGRVPDTFSHTINGLHPRSAVGLDETGTQITLVAVDGRRKGAAGMTQTQLGYLMAELGCYNAMNLDGGGSTLLAVKEANEHKVINSPSDSYKRPVSNSIGILTETSPAVMTAVRLEAQENVLLSDTGRSLSMVALDQYNRVMKTLPFDEISWSVLEGKGYFSHGKFYGTESGEVRIRGEIGGFCDEMTLTVLGTPQAIYPQASEIILSKNIPLTIKVTGTDVNERSASIEWDDFSCSVNNDSLSLSLDKLTARDAVSGLLTVSWGSLINYANVRTSDSAPLPLPEPVISADPQHVPSGSPKKNAFSFTVSGRTRETKTLFDLYLMNGMMNHTKSDAALNFYVGDGVNRTHLKESDAWVADSYRCQTIQNNTFITLNSLSGSSLFDKDKTQWNRLMEDIKSNSGNPLFLFINNESLSSLEIEVTLLKKQLEKAALSAPVYIFTGGNSNTLRIENGVRYLTCPGISDAVGLHAPAEHASSVNYYHVMINDGNVTYESKQILP